MARESERVRAIDAIYAAAIEPEKWLYALDALRCLCNAESASHSLQHITNGTGKRTAIGYDLPHQPQYFDGFAARNELFTGLLRQPVGRPHPHQTLVDDDLFRQGYYFNEYCRPNSLHFMAGMVIAQRDNVVEWISVNRGPRGTPYDQQQLRTLDWLAPHLRRASDASHRLIEAHAARTAWETALDTLRYGVVLLNRSGHVVFANRTARQLDAAHDGLALRSTGISAPAAASTLVQAIGLATDGDSDGVRHGGHVALPRRNASCPLSVTVIPLRSECCWQFSEVPVALLLIVDPTRPASSDAQVLGTVLGLTDREAALTTLLANGYRLNDAARQLGIGRETARTHLARALNKTDTERQADLVRLALATVSPVTRAYPNKRAAGQGSHSILLVQPEGCSGTAGRGLSSAHRA